MGNTGDVRCGPTSDWLDILEGISNCIYIWIFGVNIQIWAEILLEYGVLCLMQGQGPMLCEEVLHKAPPFKQPLRGCQSMSLSGEKMSLRVSSTIWVLCCFSVLCTSNYLHVYFYYLLSLFSVIFIFVFVFIFIFIINYLHHFSFINRHLSS